MTVREAFNAAGFPVPDGESLCFTKNCGYWDGWPESEDGPVMWWLGESQTPFLFGKWNDDATAGMMMSHEENTMDVSELPVRFATDYLPEEVASHVAVAPHLTSPRSQ